LIDRLRRGDEIVRLDRRDERRVDYSVGKYFGHYSDGARLRNEVAYQVGIARRWYNNPGDADQRAWVKQRGESLGIGGLNFVGEAGAGQAAVGDG
jgi:hypothetical protein